MKRVMVLMGALVLSFFAINSLAENIGVVDMRAVMQSSPKLKKMTTNLQKKLNRQRLALMKQQKELMVSIGKLQKNKSIMSTSDLKKLKTTITRQETDFRQAQAQFQQAAFNAQNSAMSDIFNQIKSQISKVAKQKNLDLVLPKTMVLYSKNQLDVTSSVEKLVD